MPIKLKVCNTKDYNEALKKRGAIFHLFEEATKTWLYTDAQKKEKSKFVYSNELIKVSAALRYLLNYPFRQLQGLLEDYLQFAKIELPIPDFTTLCRRMAKLALTIKDHRKSHQMNEPVDILIDSTGINIYHTGGGHSKENSALRQKKHYEQVRKLHVAMDAKSKDVVAMEMTPGTVHDGVIAPILISNINLCIQSVFADKAYDQVGVRTACFKRNIRQVIPPKRNAAIRESRGNEPQGLWTERNVAVNLINSGDQEEGVNAWKKMHGYGKRALVEALFSRFKAIFGFHFLSKIESAREVELMTKINLLNSFNKLGAAIYQK